MKKKNYSPRYYPFMVDMINNFVTPRRTMLIVHRLLHA
jgi:hypothetical protein